MFTIQELREKLKRPLVVELNNGCTDKVVSGGVEQLINSVTANPFPEVRELLSGYAGMPKEERKVAIAAAIAKLEVQPAAPKPAKAADPVSGRLLPESPVEQLDTGQGGARKLKSLGLHQLRDVLHAYPHRHEDRRALPDISSATDGQRVTVAGKVISKNRHSPKPNMLILDAVLEMPSGARVKASWFNQPWTERHLKEGSKLIVTGRVKQFGGRMQIGVEHLETLESAQESLSAGRIVGVYDSKEGISQDFLRRAAHIALQKAPLSDYLPAHWRKKYSITDLPDALWGIHFPNNEEHISRADNRLRFDEYLFLELRMLLQGDDSVLHGKRFVASGEDINRFESILPFSFTAAQRRVLFEITEDMRSDKQMARLVQGDVGSGKTAVAACALYLAFRDGYQGALMAPTEILARQHYKNLSAYFEKLGVKVGLLTGTMTPKQKLAMQTYIAGGAVDIIVGTQALIQDNVHFANLGLAVVDEEHRFGVQQRRKLLSSRPDLLVMSATPIPRSLALTAYGDLELSVIDELPPGRTPIQTSLIQDGYRSQAYGFVMTQIREGRQAYVVTALIEENENLELLAASQLADDLRVILPEARIELLHGKMPAAEKDEVMERFRTHDFDILVSTTVIEVGVDVPNATVMVIENSERFGLAQLHQLRGRVGRGSAKSYCVLIAGEHSQKTRKRLKVIESSTDGFVIAEADLKLRGPGEIRGTRQSGIPDLRLADLAKDSEIIERARELAKYILANDPKLEHPRLEYLKSELQNRSNSVAYREII